MTVIIHKEDSEKAVQVQKAIDKKIRNEWKYIFADTSLFISLME
jgi:hypothetical protein